MTRNASTPTDIAGLLEALGNKDGMVRKKAREALVARGESASAPLMQRLQDSDSEQVRWEAAKALETIQDPKSIPVLVHALEDNDSDVAWIAADALKRFKKAAWPALLTALIAGTPEAGALYQGAHHVLADQREAGYEDLLPALLRDLEEGELSEAVIVAAHEILDRLKREA